MYQTVVGLKDVKKFTAAADPLPYPLIAGAV